jgi:rfaE bifunctional protein kinase chain/domain
MRALLEKIKGRRVVVIGDVMIDHYLHGDCHRISPEAPVPVVHVDKERHVAGGAANVAINIRALGGFATLCGVTGRDSAGHELAGLLDKEGVAYPAAFQREGVTTIIKTRVVVRNQQLCRIDREREPAHYEFDADARVALLAEVAKADAVILSDYAKGAISASIVAAVIAEAAKRGTLVALDPKPRRKLTVTGVGLMTPNKAEALELAGMTPDDCYGGFPADEVCRRIFEQYRPKHLVITLGGDGMLLSENGRPGKTIPTYAREVFDVCGAGDTVIATLTAALAAGADIESAAHLANTAAGVVVGKFGTATATPEEILNFHP